MTRFADQLFDDLMRDHGTALEEAEAPAPRGRRVSRPIWMTAGTLAAVGATAGGLVLAGGGSAAAFTVTENGNGSTTVTLKQLTGIDGANARLRILGDRVVIVQIRPGCPSLASLPGPGPSSFPPRLVRVENGGATVTINAGNIPRGETVLIGAAEQRNGVSLLIAVITGPVPSCVSLPDPAAKVAPSN